MSLTAIGMVTRMRNFFMNSLVAPNNCWCDALNGEKIPEWWDWLDKAQFAHNITNMEGKTFNIWSMFRPPQPLHASAQATDPVFYSHCIRLQ